HSNPPDRARIELDFRHDRFRDEGFSESVMPSAREIIWNLASMGRASGFAAHSRTVPDARARMNSTVCRSGKAGRIPAFAQSSVKAEANRSTARAGEAAYRRFSSRSREASARNSMTARSHADSLNA